MAECGKQIYRCDHFSSQPALEAWQSSQLLMILFVDLKKSQNILEINDTRGKTV